MALFLIEIYLFIIFLNLPSNQHIHQCVLLSFLSFVAHIFLQASFWMKRSVVLEFYPLFMHELDECAVRPQ